MPTPIKKEFDMNRIIGRLDDHLADTGMRIQRLALALQLSRFDDIERRWDGPIPPHVLAERSRLRRAAKQLEG